MMSHTHLNLLLPGYTQLTYTFTAGGSKGDQAKENGSLTRRTLSLRYPKNKGRPINKIKKEAYIPVLRLPDTNKSIATNTLSHIHVLHSWQRKKRGEQVNQKLLYRESDWWDVGLGVQKARKQGTVC